MKKMLHFIDHFEENLLFFLLPFMCVVIFVTTFARFTKTFMIPWGEELARYCMVWIIFLGVGAAAKRGEHFSVTAVTGALPSRVQNLLTVLRNIILVGFNLFVAWFCMKIFQNQMMMQQVTPSLKWPMWLIYAAIPVGSVLMAIRYTTHSIQEIRSKTDVGGGEQV